MTSVLICATPAHGHIAPLVPVARHLLAAGHRVRVMTGRKYAETFTSVGAEFIALPREADVDLDNPNEVFPERARLSGVADVRFSLLNLFIRPGAAQYQALRDVIQHDAPDIILAEPLFTGVALLLLARPHGQRPAVAHLSTVPLSLSSVDTAPFGLGVAPRPGALGRVRNAALDFVAQRLLFRTLQREANAMALRETGQPLPVFIMNMLALSDTVVQFTVPSFEYPRSDLPTAVDFVGPLVADPATTATASATRPDWWHELDGGRPVVHVTQGTVANDDFSRLILPTVEALARTDALVVVSAGGRDVSTLPADLPANVRVSSYLDYDALLPRTDVMVTNAGYGGVHQALRYGVPLVVAGATEDKMEVAARVGWSGVGINLKTAVPTVQAVKRAVSTIRTDDRYRHAAQRISDEIASAPGLAGIDAVIARLTASSQDDSGSAPSGAVASALDVAQARVDATGSIA